MQPAEAYSFGPFILDTTCMAVMEGNREIKLRRKAFDTLLVLLRKHDQC